MLEPIKTEKLYQIIMKRISDLIDEQKLEPGDKLPSERELASALSVSRASVRQGIAALSAKGLLVMRQGDGTYLSDIKEEKGHVLELFGKFMVKTLVDPDDIHESRIMVECEAARLCAGRATDEQLLKIRKIHLLKMDTDHDETKENARLNKELHYAIAEGAHNQVLLMFMEVLWNIMGNNMRPLLKQESSQHEAIVNAICARDGDGTYKAMYSHLTSIRDGINKVIRKTCSP